MADVQLSETSPPLAAALFTDSSVNVEGGGSGPDAGGREAGAGGSGRAEIVGESQGQTVMGESNTHAKDSGGDPVVAQQASSSTASFSPDNRTGIDNATFTESGHHQSQPQTSSTFNHPPLKRFTSVNITKRFLEKTPLPSGLSPGGGSSSGHHPPGNTAASAQRRGNSPSSTRSPSTDRPAPLGSRLVTTKLTAVPQPLSGSTAGWLKPNQTPGSSATPTPLSSSPQPTHDASSSVSQTVKPRRPGESVNGTTPPPPFSAPQPSNKLVWRKAPPAPLARSPAVSDNQEDFPTAAEAVHGRKPQMSKAQVEAEAAAAQKAAALNETAAAFRGAHLDANARHWDEMEDEDSDFLNGVIEFGDGRQYNVEQRRESEDEHHPQSPLPEPESQEPVPKEERFGKDIGRHWPKGRPSIRQSQPIALPPRPTPLQPPGRSPTDGPPSASAQSPQDGISPTSRVLFNERSNRLEPWNSAKPPRHQGPAQPGSVHLLQKGPSESAWKSGPPRGFGDRGRWDGPPRGLPSGKDEERPWELQRRESVSSVAASSIRERSRGRESRLEGDRHHNRRDSNVSGTLPAPILPPSLSRENGRHPPPHPRMPPPAAPPMPRPSSRDFLYGPSHSPTSPSASVRSIRSLVSEQGPSLPPPPPPPADVIDKDALVKDAMHLANERARRRKQEGEEEERQRSEAAERARKKAEAIAAELEEKKKKAEEQVALEEKRKAEEEEKRKVEAAETALAQKKQAEDQIAALQKAKEEPEKPSLQRLSRPVGHEPFRERSTFDVARPHPPGTLPRKPVIGFSPAAQAESWRSRAPSGAPPPVIAKPPPPAPSPTPSVLLRPPSAPIDSSAPASAPAKLSLSQVTQSSELDLSIKPDEEVEVVDFCDMEKLMSSTKTEPSGDPLEAASRPRRPVAADFFNDTPEVSAVSKVSQLSWRRSAPKLSSADELRTQTVPIFSAEEPPPSKPSISVPGTEAKSPTSPTISSSRRFVPHADQGISNGSSIIIGARSRVAGQYREAPMSALDDTMSRIKGALDGMQSQDSVNVGSSSMNMPEGRQVHVASAKSLSETSTSWRSQRELVRTEPPRPPVSNTTQRSAPPPLVQAEPFATSRAPPPPSPKPVWNVFTVRIPKVSLSRDPLSRKQQHLWNVPYQGVRWDILSWDPPVEGMSKKELSRDEIFHKKNAIKNNGKIRVSLPTRRIEEFTADDNPSLSPQSVQQTTVVTAAGVKVKLPSVSSFRQRVSPPQDTVPLWRKSAMPLTPLRKGQSKVGSVGATDIELNTISRSPPPDPSTPITLTNPTSESTALSEQSATVSLPTSETKSSIGRGPIGQDEGMSRTIKGDSGVVTNSSKFVLHSVFNSDLDASKARDFTPSKSRVASDPMSNGSFGTLTQPAISRFVSNRRSGNKDNHEHFAGGSSETTTSTHPTPPWGKQTLGFSAKDSPGRSVPDPEHLKAVWSQSTTQPFGNTSNSLKGITDELPSIPFNVQDMKSEDGETPPPTAPAPTTTRLSLQEVTRAFQQVPDSPAGPSSRPNAYAPAPFVSQAHRLNQPVAITLPPGQPMRPTYAPYPHAIVGHSPSPTLMYAPGMPSPITHHRMPVNGPSPPVAHGMWLSTPQPPSSQHGTWRPAAPSGTPTMMYPHPGSMATPGQVMPRRMSVISPPNVQAAPTGMYGSIPMDMHARSSHPPAMGVPMGPMHMGPMFSPQPGQAPMYAMPVGAGRGSVVPRPGYEGYPAMPPHAASYHHSPSFMFQQS